MAAWQLHVTPNGRDFVDRFPAGDLVQGFLCQARKVGIGLFGEHTSRLGTEEKTLKKVGVRPWIRSERLYAVVIHQNSICRLQKLT